MVVSLQPNRLDVCINSCSLPGREPTRLVFGLLQCLWWLGQGGLCLGQTSSKFQSQGEKTTPAPLHVTRKRKKHPSEKYHACLQSSSGKLHIAWTVGFPGQPKPTEEPIHFKALPTLPLSDIRCMPAFSSHHWFTPHHHHHTTPDRRLFQDPGPGFLRP